MKSDTLNLMPGAWRVEVVKTITESVWVLADSKDAAMKEAEQGAFAAGAVSATAVDCRPPTVQEAEQWYRKFAAPPA